MRNLSIIPPNYQALNPSFTLHKWITTDEIFRDKINKENYGWHSRTLAVYISLLCLHICISISQTALLGRARTPLDWRCTSSTCCLTQQNHMLEAFTFTNESERLGRRDFCIVLRQANDVWTSCWLFDDCSQDPTVVAGSLHLVDKVNFLGQILWSLSSLTKP